jgi:NAD-dependent SIR2 family protein deacetylase
LQTEQRACVLARGPQELFDLEAFDDDPAPFWSFAHALWPGDAIRPSLTHRFLAALAKEKRLLRVSHPSLRRPFTL